MNRRLKDLKPGESARVVKISVDGKARLRLLEMGLTPGVWVQATRRAPLGDPIEISLRGYQLTLRGDDAQKIELAPPAQKEDADDLLYRSGGQSQQRKNHAF